MIMVDPGDCSCRGMTHDANCPENAVTVTISNNYTCGRESGSEHVLRPPPMGADENTMDCWFDLYVHDLTGDGHPCGSREHAYYEATITEAPGRPELVGQSYSWEG
jgi:hypothetical protein